MTRLILASGSPRRREILKRLGYRFTVRPVDLDESRLPGERALDYVRRLAEEKARADARPGELVLGADTIVVLGEELLGKPEDEEAAVSMLERLSGQEHLVLTGIAVYRVDDDHLVVEAETTRVRFLPLEEQAIRSYVRTGEPMDKAGAYAIQGGGGRFVESIDGSFSNVVGLPEALARRLLAS